MLRFVVLDPCRGQDGTREEHGLCFVLIKSLSWPAGEFFFSPNLGKLGVRMWGFFVCLDFCLFVHLLLFCLSF